METFNLTVRDFSSFDNQTGVARNTQGQSIGTFIASLTSGLTVAGIQVLLFLLIKDRFPRI